MIIIIANIVREFFESNKIMAVAGKTSLLHKQIIARRFGSLSQLNEFHITSIDMMNITIIIIFLNGRMIYHQFFIIGANSIRNDEIIMITDELSQIRLAM